MAEARNVKEDLVELMDDALYFSQSIVDDLDKRVTAAGETDSEPVIRTEGPEASDNGSSKVVTLNPCSKDRIRVYDLAKEMHIPSRELVDLLQDCGLKVTSHMNLIDAGQARALVNNSGNTAGLAGKTAKPLPGQDFFPNDACSATLQSAHPYIAVRNLYEQGYPVWQIAKMMGRGQGEVNLILNLANKKAGSI